MWKFVSVFATIVGLVMNSSCASSGRTTKPSAPPPASAQSLIENASIGSLDKVRAILDQAPGLITASDDEGFTPLHLAASPGTRGGYRIMMDYAGTVELLLNRGANVNAVARDGITPLHAVAAYEAPRIRPGEHLTVGGRPYAEHLAAMQLRSLKAILLRKPDVNARTVDLGMTPLHAAALLGHTDIVKVLLEYGADPGLLTKSGKTALDLAREAGKSDVAAILTGR